MRFITGIDLSAKMRELERVLRAGPPDGGFQLTDGCDLRGFAAASVDAMLAIDSFP